MRWAGLPDISDFYSAHIIQRRRKGQKITRYAREKTCCCGQGLGERRAGSLPTCSCQNFACWGAAPCPALKVLHLIFLLLLCPQAVPLKPEEEPDFTAFCCSLVLTGSRAQICFFFSCSSLVILCSPVIAEHYTKCITIIYWTGAV